MDEALQHMDDARNTEKILYNKPTYTKDDVRGDRRLEGKMMERMT